MWRSNLLLFEGDFLIIPGYLVDTITLMMDFKSPRPLSGEVAEVEEDPYTTWYLRTALELMKVRHVSRVRLILCIFLADLDVQH